VLERYCRGVDRGDEELLQSVYWPESIDDHGIWKGPGQDFAAFVVPALKARYISTMHSIHQSNIRVKGVKAAADTNCIAMHRAERDGAIVCDLAFCRYVDEMEKRGNEWRILDRIVIMEHTHTLTVDDSNAIPMESFPWGAKDRSDPSYAMFARLEG
jgi:hypothetical protein